MHQHLMLQYYPYTQVIEYVQKILSKRQHSFTTTAAKEILQDIQEKLLYVALDYEDKLHNEEISSEYDN